jgi:hypothetical protein
VKRPQNKRFKVAIKIKNPCIVGVTTQQPIQRF